MTRRALLAVVATVVVTALLPAAGASACSCVPLSPEFVRDADAAAVAKLTSVEPLADGRRARFTYSVRRVLVGAHRLDRDRIRVVASLSSASCGLPQRKRRYGLVLNRIHHRWSASLCSVTSPAGLRALVEGERARAYCWGMPR